MTTRATTRRPHGRNGYQPDQVSPPGETLCDLLNERGWTLLDSAERVGMSEAQLRALMNGKAGLDGSTAGKLEEATGIAAGFWLAREANYRSQESLRRMGGD